jgi:hypothetical protein
MSRARRSLFIALRFLWMPDVQRCSGSHGTIRAVM